jgi:hypothetical protein
MLIAVYTAWTAILSVAGTTTWAVLRFSSSYTANSTHTQLISTDVANERHETGNDYLAIAPTPVKSASVKDDTSAGVASVKPVVASTSVALAVVPGSVEFVSAFGIHQAGSIHLLQHGLVHVGLIRQIQRFV